MNDVAPSGPSLNQLAAQANTEHARVGAAFRDGLAHAMECGLLLAEAKARVGHGAWLSWLAEHCPDISDRQAQRYMQVARELPKLDPANTTRVSDMTFRQALHLLSYQAEKVRRHGPAILDHSDPQTIPSALADLEHRKYREERAARRSAKRRELERQREALDAAKREEEFGEPPPVPEPTANQWHLCGLGQQELEVLLDELARSAQWYEGLVARLSTDYEYAVPRLARKAATAVWMLRERLTYDREQLQHAVYGLREQLLAGPQPAGEIRDWARRANVSRGLLALARRIVGVVQIGNQWQIGEPSGPDEIVGTP